MKLFLSVSELLTIAVLTSLISACTTKPSNSRHLSTTEIKHPSAELPVSSKIAVGTTFTDWMGVGFGSLWAPVGTDVMRIDPETDKVIPIPIESGKYRGVGVGPKSVWILNVTTKNLYEIDPATNKRSHTYKLNVDGNSEGSIGVDEDSVWVVTIVDGTTKRQLSRIDARTGQIIANIPVSDQAVGVVAAYGAVWVTERSESKLTRIDTKLNTITDSIPTGKNPRFLSAGENAIWTLNQGDGTVTRVDIATGKVTSIDAKAPGDGGDISVGDGYVWVTIMDSPVIKIDPRTNQVVERFDGDVGADAIRWGLGYVWISEHEGKIWKIKL